MARGILATVGLAATLALAIPVGLIGLDFLARGDPLGAVFLAIAAGMVLLERYVLTPGDLLGRAVERLVGRVVKVPDDEE